METLHPGRAGNNCVSCATINKMIVSTFIRNVFYSITEGVYSFLHFVVRNEGVAWCGSLISPEEDRAKKRETAPFLLSLFQLLIRRRVRVMSSVHSF
jgi:hypothetical protein